MTIQLYNSKTRTLEPFTPVEPGHAKVYVCGATVQGSPHIGHMRSAVVFDQLTRWLTYRGYTVTLVRNVTDIDDKILTKSVEEGRPWWAHAYLYEQEFAAAYDAMGVLRPTYEPRATGHIPEMIELISRLIDRGHAYPADDGSGDVYFATGSWPEYGGLTNQELDSLEDAETDLRGKREPHDFSLWKGHKEDEPLTASWGTPWGRGRPGWHIECSAMSVKYLGSHFDIHGGGLDLRFPHHENEMAQSNAAGDAFANLWMHSGLVNVDGNKMSKSLGNSVFAHDLFAEYSPLLVRFFFTSGHYRSQLDFTRDNIAKQQAAVDRITNFLTRARTEGEGAAEGGDGLGDGIPDEFAQAMDDDLSTPRALAVVFDHVGRGYKLLEQGESAAAAGVARQVEAMLDTLGINPLGPQWATDAGGAEKQALDALVTELLERRQEAKQAKDYATADAIRDQLTAAGITTEDTPDGFRYQVKNG